MWNFVIFHLNCCSVIDNPQCCMSSIQPTIVRYTSCVNTLSGPCFLGFVLLVMSMNTTKTIRFFNQNYNKGKLSSKSRSWNKENKNKNTTNENKNPTKHYCKKKILTRLWQENIPKISVQQTKNNEEFYFYLYPLGT
jgi:hypothetical protein